MGDITDVDYVHAKSVCKDLEIKNIDMNTDIRKKLKNDFEKDFFALMNNAAFGKTLENVRKHRDIKLVSTEKIRNFLASEPNYNTAKFFAENRLPIEMEKIEILMNKPVYLRLSILELRKILMYEFKYDYVKPKYDEKANLCYMDPDIFIVYIKKVIFTRILWKILRQDLTLQIMNQGDHCLNNRMKK